MPDPEEKTRARFGDGSIRTRADGLMEKRISLGVDPRTGRYIRKSVYGRNETELRRKAKALEARFREGLVVETSDRITLDEHFDRWVNRKSVKLEERTLRNYRLDYERYVKPHLGGTRMDPQALTEDRVEEWHAQIARAHGAYTANRALGLLANVLKGHRVMRRAAPTKAVEPAKHEREPVEILTAEELGVFLPAARRTRLRHMFELALATGLRHGEAAALHWRDVKLYPKPAENGDHGELHVRRAVVVNEDGERVLGRPKSKSAVRTIGLMPEAAEALREQKALLEAEGLASSPLVFPNAAGKLQDETNTARALRAVIDSCNPRLVEWMTDRRAALRQAGVTARRARAQAWQEAQALPEFLELLDVKYVSFHDLRHTFASMMIAAGMDAPRLAVLLGHSDSAFTMRTYVHFFERADRPGMPSIRQFVPSLEPLWGKPQSSLG